MRQLMENLFRLQTLEFEEAANARNHATIADLRGKIPAPVLEHYDRMRSRGKKGVAAVRHQVCTGCHMRVPLAAIITIQHGHDLRLCDSCDRYLYLPPEEEQQVLPPPAAVSKRALRRPGARAA